MHYVDAKAILSHRNGMNVYRGCTHGCIYCDSRSVCYGMKHAFEDVEVKRNAAELLDDALWRKRERCMVGTGSMADPYMPLERTERLTRRCMEVIERRGFGASTITKSDLILRDMDLIKSINQKAKFVAQITLTTYDERLCKIVEPAVCATTRRLEVLDELRKEGIPTVVWLSPILPFINDTRENLRGILKGCFETGVKGILCFGMGVTLREGDREYFYGKLDEHFPGLKRKYASVYGNSYECASSHNDELMRIFTDECDKRGVMCDTKRIFAYLSEFEDKRGGEQLGFL